MEPSASKMSSEICYSRRIRWTIDGWITFRNFNDDQQKIADIVVDDLDGPAIMKSEILHALRKMKNRKDKSVDNEDE